MTAYAFHNTDGHILYVCNVLNENISEPHIVVEDIPADAICKYYVVDGVLVSRPECTSAKHQWDHTTHTWIDPRSTEQMWSEVRASRDKLLVQSDWTQLPDVPTVLKTSWATYRQALRDITSQTDPAAIVWPVSP